MLKPSNLNPLDRFCIIWFAATNVLCFATFWFDKRRATALARRIPEATLALLGACGGWPAGLLAMKLFRHKTAKWTFKFKYSLALLPFAAELWAWCHWR